jgi:hypothetical protein
VKLRIDRHDKRFADHPGRLAAERKPLKSAQKTARSKSETAAFGYVVLRVARIFGFSFFGFFTSFLRLLLPLPMMNSWLFVQRAWRDAGKAQWETSMYRAERLGPLDLSLARGWLNWP